MKQVFWIIYFIGAILWDKVSATPRPKAYTLLIKITEKIFEQGVAPVEFHKDLSIKKRNGALTFTGGFAQLKDIFENGDYSSKYSYVGDVLVNHKIHIMKKQLLNGEQYVLLDMRLGCKTYLLNGKPYLSKTWLINFNESETTDLQGLVNFWQIEADGLIHVKSVKLIDNQNARTVRFSSDGTKLLFEDLQGQFWSARMPVYK